MKSGILCLSIDVELLWGRHDRDWKAFIPVTAQSRSVIKELLELLEQYEIPATWAVVGHLFLDRCSVKKNGVKHPQIIRPKYSWYRKDWFVSDPCSSSIKDPGWYGRDIVRRIKKYPRQEIACHSFSHLIFDDPGVNRRCAQSDIRACTALAKKIDVRLSSFVFPRNSIGNLPVLKKFGFRAYRGLGSTKFANLLTLFSPLSPPVHFPINNKGLINIPASMYIPSTRGLRRFIPNNAIISAAKRGIDRAVKEKKVFHLWTHPEDLVGERYSCLREILEYARLLRQQRVLDIQIMRNIS